MFGGMKVATLAADQARLRVRLRSHVSRAMDADRFVISKASSASLALAQRARERAALSPILAQSAKAKAVWCATVLSKPKCRQGWRMARESASMEWAKPAHSAVRLAICTLFCTEKRPPS